MVLRTDECDEWLITPCAGFGDDKLLETAEFDAVYANVTREEYWCCTGQRMPIEQASDQTTAQLRLPMRCAGLC